MRDQTIRPDIDSILRKAFPKGVMEPALDIQESHLAEVFPRLKTQLLELGAYSEGSRPPVPTQADHPFRRKPTIDSEASRPFGVGRRNGGRLGSEWSERAVWVLLPTGYRRLRRRTRWQRGDYR